MTCQASLAAIAAPRKQPLRKWNAPPKKGTTLWRSMVWSTDLEGARLDAARLESSYFRSLPDRPMAPVNLQSLGLGK